jgi:hypothetical protein
VHTPFRELETQGGVLLERYQTRKHGNNQVTRYKIQTSSNSKKQTGYRLSGFLVFLVF